MARSTADTTLVRGAFAAAGGNIEDYGLAATKGLSSISDTIGKQVASKLNERRAYFEDFANEELMRATDLNDDEFQALTEELNRKKEQYAWSGQKDQAMLRREMEQQKAQLDALKTTKNNLSKNILGDNKNTEGEIDKDFLSSDTGMSLIESMKTTPTANENGDLGYMVWLPDQGETFMTAPQIEKLLDKYKFDTGSANVLMEQINKAFEDAKNPLAKFNYAETEMNVRRNVIDPGKIESLVNREMIPGRTFYNDLQKSLVGTEYQALGVTEDMLNNIDESLDNVKLSDGISREEAKIITDELLKNEEMTKHYLTKYYTNFIEQNFNNENMKYSELPTDVTQRLQSGDLSMEEQEQLLKSRVNLETGKVQSASPRWRVWEGGDI